MGWRTTCERLILFSMEVGWRTNEVARRDRDVLVAS